MTRSLTALGICLWCLIVMAMGVNNAHSVWEWIWTFMFGAVAPLVLLHQAARVLEVHRPQRAGAGDELRLLAVLSEGGELTAAAIAVRTSLALDDVTARLDSMAARGHVDWRQVDGVDRYAIAGGRHESPAGR